MYIFHIIIKLQRSSVVQDPLVFVVHFCLCLNLVNDAMSFLLSTSAFCLNLVNDAMSFLLSTSAFHLNLVNDASSASGFEVGER